MGGALCCTRMHGDAAWKVRLRCVGSKKWAAHGIRQIVRGRQFENNATTELSIIFMHVSSTEVGD